MNSIALVKPTARLAIRDLGVQAYTSGFTRWVVVLRPDERTGIAHGLSDVMIPGYFDDACDMMAKGDMIDVCATDGGASLYVSEAGDEHVRVEVMCRTRAFG